MEACALCNGISREGMLLFQHVRNGERIALEIALCEACACRIEKHLKRAVPKRLMNIRRITPLPRLRTLRALSKEAA
jgi:hypothetical protein